MANANGMSIRDRIDIRNETKNEIFATNYLEQNFRRMFIRKVCTVTSSIDVLQNEAVYLVTAILVLSRFVHISNISEATSTR